MANLWLVDLCDGAKYHHGILAAIRNLLVSRELYTMPPAHVAVDYAAAITTVIRQMGGAASI